MKQPLPEKFGKFDVVQEIGKGGFGVVYEGRDPVLKRRVAIKTCNTDDVSMRQRFQREAEIVASLQHPNITTVHDLGVQDEVPYLVQEYLSGQDLSQIIIQKKELPLQRRLQILRSVATGLEHAHKRGIVHRDIKPGNVRVLENGTVKVMDFGIAKLTASSETQLTQSGMMIGTAAYLAPEQVSDVEVDHRCDIFSFGVVAYELLTFQRPFAGTTISALLYKINHEEHTPLRANLPSAPAALSSLIDDCLAKDPAGRPISFTKVLERLDEVEAEVAGGTAQASAPTAGPDEATRLQGAPQRPNTDDQSMDLAAAATMVTPSAAVDPTAETMLTPSDADASGATEQPTRLEPTTAERQVSESAMSQMFSNASKPSMIAVAVFALIAIGAVWFALSRGSGASSSSQADAAPAQSPPNGPISTEAADSGGPPVDESNERDPEESPAEEPGSETETQRPVAAAEPEAPSTRRRAPDGTGVHSAERAADRAPREPARAPENTERPATTRRTEAEDEPTRSQPSSRNSAENSASQSQANVDRPPTQPARTAAATPSPASPTPSVPDPSAVRTQPEESARAEPERSAPSSTESPREPSAAAPVDHRPAINSVLTVYRSAMEAQDSGALQRIWPSLTRRQLRRIESSFEATEAMEIEIQDCRFDIATPTATADCRVERTITPRAGRRQSNTSRTTFSFRQENGKWVLTGV